MQITLEIDNPSKIGILTELLKELSFVRQIKISDSKETVTVPKIVLSPKSWTGMTDEEAQKIIDEGCEMSSFGDPIEFQNEVPENRLYI